MIIVTDDDIKRLQNNLIVIRLCMGYSLRKFGNLLGVSQQTVCNYESGKSKINKLIYLGIRVIIDDYIKNNPDNKLLSYAVEKILEKDNYTKEDRMNVELALAYVTNSKLLGTDEKIVNDTLHKIFKEELI